MGAFSSYQQQRLPRGRPDYFIGDTAYRPAAYSRTTVGCHNNEAHVPLFDVVKNSLGGIADARSGAYFYIPVTVVPEVFFNLAQGRLCYFRAVFAVILVFFRLLGSQHRQQDNVVTQLTGDFLGVGQGYLREGRTIQRYHYFFIFTHDISPVKRLTKPRYVLLVGVEGLIKRCALQERIDPGEEFQRTERLPDKVIGTGIYGPDGGLGTGVGAYDNQGNGANFAYLMAESPAFPDGLFQGDDYIVVLTVQMLQTSFGAGRHVHSVPRFLQKFADNRAGCYVIYQ